MSSRELKEVREKLRSQPISALSGDELKIYFEYRLYNLVQTKQILVRREVEYLFGETGVGNLRIDPELITYLTVDQVFLASIVSSLMANDPEDGRALEDIVGSKKHIEKEVSGEMRSSEIWDFFGSILEKHLKSVRRDPERPYYYGKHKHVPISILFHNGIWTMPDQALLDFLQYAKANEALPIVVSKKIHGILYPIFKQISALGLNIYSTLISRRVYEEVSRFNKNYELSGETTENVRWPRIHLFSKGMRYNEQLLPIESYLASRPNEFVEALFESIVPAQAQALYGNFLKNNIVYDKSFTGLIGSLKNGKAKKIISAWEAVRAELVRSLAYGKLVVPQGTSNLD